ncbi:MAG: hypothetical protein Q9184_004399 [Pyrenodesmia sp. 2 TL-2023]
MHSLGLTATALFAAGALAGNLNQILPRELRVRQDPNQVQGEDQSFVPTITDIEQAASCADAFGAGYFQCSNTNSCYNPGLGGSCCERNGDSPYTCPPGSYCLIDNRCCPNGLSAETCAERFDITLPQGFSTDTADSVEEVTTAAQTPDSTVAATQSSTSPSVSVPTTTPIIPTPVPLPSPIPDTAPYPLPSIIPGNATKPGGPAAPTGTGAFPPVSPFTGAAASVKIYCGSLVAGLLGTLGMLL